MFGWYTRELKIINQTLIGTLIGKGLPSLVEEMDDGRGRGMMTEEANEKRWETNVVAWREGDGDLGPSY
jgi:hypothetical protein